MAPSTTPCPIFTPAPSVTRPSRTTWWPTSTPGSSVTSGPTTLKAPTRTPSPTAARRSTSAVAWMSGAGIVPCGRMALERLQPPLERAHALQQLGELALGEHDALGLEDRSRGRAEQLVARRHVGGHAGAGAHHRPVPDGDV